MARNYSATEVIDFVLDDFSNIESEEEGGEEVYSYRGRPILETSELDSLAKAVTSSERERDKDFWSERDLNEEDSEKTDGSEEQVMEIDMPGKENRYLFVYSQNLE